MKVERTKACLHRGEKTLGIIVEGWGNCETCINNEANKYCRGYTPVTNFLFYVEENPENKKLETIYQQKIKA